jgi:hypothetical protein
MFTLSSGRSLLSVCTRNTTRLPALMNIIRQGEQHHVDSATCSLNLFPCGVPFCCVNIWIIPTRIPRAWERIRTHADMHCSRNALDTFASISRRDFQICIHLRLNLSFYTFSYQRILPPHFHDAVLGNCTSVYYQGNIG